MADLLALSSRVIDSGVVDEPVNRITNELSEVADGLAVVESFSHSVVMDAGEGLVAFDASHARTGADVAAAIRGWTPTPVTHLVYTHGHADHVGGSPAFAEAFGDMTVVGHANVEARFDRYRYTNDWNVRINARQFGGVRGDYGMGDTLDFIPPTTLRPSHVVDDHDTITVGDHTIELHHARTLPGCRSTGFTAHPSRSRRSRPAAPLSSSVPQARVVTAATPSIAPRRPCPPVWPPPGIGSGS